ncbi:predicted protein [Nematostella vectensis]|uniref:Uncharacterized protein n=1 Tax=Nematostella vectensis TaxID=45351 RepID=A7SGC8_NEMVE|nr:uncharacterized protein LOC5508725 isoform X2 [Nematostella vectensis]EDO37224.1 predicted protein [Nematostella vectensis]|eukprot:XP_001629287.1 predicted protein [Nematostella vectensis]
MTVVIAGPSSPKASLGGSGRCGPSNALKLDNSGGRYICCCDTDYCNMDINAKRSQLPNRSKAIENALAPTTTTLAKNQYRTQEETKQVTTRRPQPSVVAEGLVRNTANCSTDTAEDHKHYVAVTVNHDILAVILLSASLPLTALLLIVAAVAIYMRWRKAITAVQEFEAVKLTKVTPLQSHKFNAPGGIKRMMSEQKVVHFNLNQPDSPCGARGAMGSPDRESNV